MYHIQESIVISRMPLTSYKYTESIFIFTNKLVYFHIFCHWVGFPSCELVVHYFCYLCTVANTRANKRNTYRQTFAYAIISLSISLFFACTVSRFQEAHPQHTPLGAYTKNFLQGLQLGIVKDLMQNEKDGHLTVERQGVNVQLLL